MRDRIARLLARAMRATGTYPPGRHARTSPPPPPRRAHAPETRPGKGEPQPLAAPRTTLPAEDGPALVRPYLVAHEQRCERERARQERDRPDIALLAGTARARRGRELTAEPAVLVREAVAA